MHGTQNMKCEANSNKTHFCLNDNSRIIQLNVALYEDAQSAVKWAKN